MPIKLKIGLLLTLMLFVYLVTKCSENDKHFTQKCDEFCSATGLKVVFCSKEKAMVVCE